MKPKLGNGADAFLDLALVLHYTDKLIQPRSGSHASEDSDDGFAVRLRGFRRGLAESQSVGGKLAVSAQASECPPKNRIKPVNGLEECHDPTSLDIPATDMSEFVKKNVVQFGRG